jgi:hypothetical protein
LRPDRYSSWFGYVFREDDEQFLSFSPFDLSDSETAELIIYALQNCAQELLPLKEKKLCAGLKNIFNPSFGNYIYSLRTHNVTQIQRLMTIRSCTKLYSELFEVRCKPICSHLSEPGGTDLNHVCFMLWDVTPLNYWENWENPVEKFELESAIIDLFRTVLQTSNNVACIESVLHGINHTGLYDYDERGIYRDLTTWFITNRGNEFPHALSVYADIAGDAGAQ